MGAEVVSWGFLGPLHGPNPQQMPPAPPPPMAEEAQARPEPAKPWQGQSKGAGAIFRPCGPHTLIPLLFTLSTYSFNKYCLIKTLEGSSWASPGWENQGRRCWVVPGVAVSKEVKGCGRQCVISEMGVGAGSPPARCVWVGGSWSPLPTPDLAAQAQARALPSAFWDRPLFSLKA